MGLLISVYAISLLGFDSLLLLRLLNLGVTQDLPFRNIGKFPRHVGGLHEPGDKSTVLPDKLLDDFDLLLTARGDTDVPHERAGFENAREVTRFDRYIP